MRFEPADFMPVRELRQQAVLRRLAALNSKLLHALELCPTPARETAPGNAFQSPPPTHNGTSAGTHRDPQSSAPLLELGRR